MPQWKITAAGYRSIREHCGWYENNTQLNPSLLPRPYTLPHPKFDSDKIFSSCDGGILLPYDS